MFDGSPFATSSVLREDCGIYEHLHFLEIPNMHTTHGEKQLLRGYATPKVVKIAELCTY